MHVIGTAGHVDHGKSTLVRALSGIDPDRLQEEKRRGMTIDLGFAWIELALPDGSADSVGIVDVPGHIDFIKNMLAGIGGIDAALLVIAADEGVMPQTREHLAILDLLAIPAALVVLSKVDLIDDPDWLDLVELDVHDLLQGTQLAAAPIVRVSAATGAGLDTLRSQLARLLSALPPRSDRARPRLPVDRVFSLSGLGTIVTGTLSDGQLAVGDAVEILPSGQSARIRGLQTHKQPVAAGEPGSRLAINLSGVSVDAVHRGDVVVRPGSLTPTMLLDARFRLLAGAPPLKHNQRVDFFAGAAEVPAYVRVLGVDQLAPGQEGWLQVRLDRPVAVVAGDRFILRQPSPSATLGGGSVLSAAPRRRWRRFDPAALARLQTLARGAPDAILLQALARSPLATPSELLSAGGLDSADGRRTLDELMDAGAIKIVGAGSELLLATLDAWARLLQGLRRLLSDFHRQAPLRPGLPRSEVRSRLAVAGRPGPLPVRHFNTVIGAAAAEGVIRADDSFVALADFQVKFTPAQQAAVDRLLAAYARAPFNPPNQAETLALLGQDEDLLAALMAQGQIVRIGGDVLLRSQDCDAMLAAVRAYLQANGAITLAQARDLLQTSRKYAQALLEEMDARRITRREEDYRVLR